MVETAMCGLSKLDQSIYGDISTICHYRTAVLLRVYAGYYARRSSVLRNGAKLGLCYGDEGLLLDRMIIMYFVGESIYTNS